MASSSATQLKHKSRVIVTNECIITLFVEPLNPEACLPGFFFYLLGMATTSGFGG
jgi:hypothetical protein